MDYSVYRPSGSHLKRTGGQGKWPAAGYGAGQRYRPVGHARRVAPVGNLCVAALAAWRRQRLPEDEELERHAGGDTTIGKLKEADFNFRAPMDFTNISVNYDTAWQNQYWDTGDVGEVFKENVRQALSTSEPGFSFNYMKDEETLRNACTEVTSADPDDVCNLGSINMSRIDTVTEFADVVTLATKFLLCGTIRGKVPYEAIERTREKNRRLGLGLMGMHEWLIQEENAMKLPMNFISGCTSTRRLATLPVDLLLISVQLVVLLLIGPLLLLGRLASWLAQVRGSNRSLLSPISGVICKGSDRWHYQYVVDSAAQELIDRYGADPDKIESALDLAADPERRIKFQADVQDYVDMSISSTINLPAWGSDLNNEDTVEPFADMLARYAHRLRGFTCYADGSRGGQPLTAVPYSEASNRQGEELVETHDICDITGHGGSCGV